MKDPESTIAYKVTNAAVAAGVAEQVVERAIHSGALRAKKYGRGYRIGAIELNVWLEERQAKGSPS